MNTIAAVTTRFLDTIGYPLSSMLLVVLWPLVAYSQTSRVNVAFIGLEWSDAPGLMPPASVIDFESGDFVHDFYEHQSNGTLDVRVHVVPTKFNRGPRKYGHVCTESAGCVNDWDSNADPTIGTTEPAIYQAIAAGMLVYDPNRGLFPLGLTSDEDRIAGVVFFNTLPATCPPPPSPNPEKAKRKLPGVWLGRVRYRTPSAGLSRDRVHVMYADLDNDDDCIITRGLDAGVLMHEVGHMLAANPAHPTGYTSVYELMDSGYAPNSIGAWPRLPDSFLYDEDVRFYNGWIPPSDIVQYDHTMTGGTDVLSPIAAAATYSTAPQAVVAYTNIGYYYVAECRTAFGFDSLIGTGAPGFWGFEGLRINKVIDGLQQPVLGPRFCSGPPPGCVEPWTAWKSTFEPGESYYDADADLTLTAGPFVADSCTLTTDYGPGSGTNRPDVGMLPWLSAPLDQYESFDIWVDSSCNGYLSDDPTDLSRMKYGVHSDGTPVGNGDDPCVDHENLVFARIRNFGGAEALNAVVIVESTDPLGVGIHGATGWNEIGRVTVPRIDPYDSVLVSVPWMPTAGSTPPSMGAFTFHSCIRVRVEPVANELILGNQDGEGEQENITYFESVYDTASGLFLPYEGTLVLRNAENVQAEFALDVEYQSVPSDWELIIGTGTTSIFVPAASTIEVPVRLEVGPGATPGTTATVNVAAYRKVPHYDPLGRLIETQARFEDGVTFTLSTPWLANLSLAVALLPDPDGHALEASGCLSPAVAHVSLTVDFAQVGGFTYPVVVETNASGCYTAKLYGATSGSWDVKAHWPGNATYGRTESATVSLSF